MERSLLRFLFTVRWHLHFCQDSDRRCKEDTIPWRSSARQAYELCFVGLLRANSACSEWLAMLFVDQHLQNAEFLLYSARSDVLGKGLRA